MAYLEDGTDKPIHRAGIETHILRTDLWTQQGKEKVGRIERAAHYHVENR